MPGKDPAQIGYEEREILYFLMIPPPIGDIEKDNYLYIDFLQELRR